MNQPNAAIHVAYAEDQEIVRLGIAGIINAMDGIQVTILVENGKQLIDQIAAAKRKPDVCILDLHMKGQNGLDTLIELRKRWPEIPVMVLTMEKNEHYVIKMLQNGAKAYLFKNIGPKVLERAIRTVYKKENYYTEYVTRSLMNSVRHGYIDAHHLTPTEIIVLQQCCSDNTYDEIAHKMGIKTKTVEGYRDSIYKKLNVHTRAGLVMYAIMYGLVPLEVHCEDGRGYYEQPKPS